MCHVHSQDSFPQPGSHIVSFGVVYKQNGIEATLVLNEHPYVRAVLSSL